MYNLKKYTGLVLGIVILAMMIFPHWFFAGAVSMSLIGVFVQLPQKNVSGASKIFLADKSVVTGITVTANEVSAITGTTPFMRIDTIQDSVGWEQTPERVGLNNAKVANKIEFDVMPRSTATNVLLQAIIDGSPIGSFAIIVDGNAKCWLVGFNQTDLMLRPLKLTKITDKTGKGLNDATGNVHTVEIGNECSGLAIPFDTATTAAILAGTATFCKWS